MPDALIVSAARTAVGTSFRGSLVETDAHALARAAVQAAVQRSGLSPNQIDDLILAESMAGGGVLARYCAVELGMTAVPGLAVNRHCAGGLTSIGLAAAAIRSGVEQVIVAGGVESGSTAPILRERLDSEEPWLMDPHPDHEGAPARDVSICVGWNTAVVAGLTRAQLDAWAVRSHRRAVAAIDRGQFVDEIVALNVRRDGETHIFDEDEHPRRDTSEAILASLKVLHPEIDGFSITAGNSSGMNDGAAAVVIASSDVVTEQGLRPMARIRGWAPVGVEPARTGLAVIPAIHKALGRAGLTRADIDLWEINEAFASVPLAACRELGLDEERVNPFGSGCSLGHPIAATGARMVTTLAHELARGGGRTAVAAMCAGGGMGYAVVLEAVDE